MSKSKPKTKHIKSNLDYHFTPDELRSLGKDLAESQIRLRQLDDDRKMDKVSSGYEYRDIPCTVTMDDPINGQKTIRRDDTGGTVKILEMDESDKQEELFEEQETSA